MHIPWLYALTCTIALILIKTVVDSLRSPLRNVPGPLLARFTRLWYFFRVKKGQYHWENIELHRNHGKVFRYGPTRYSISDPDAMKTIYGFGQGYNKSDWYGAFSPTRDRSLFTTQDNKIHAGQRRKYQTNYTMSSMVSYESFVDECTAIFRERLNEKARSGDLMDMAWWFNCYATDTVAMISSSKRLGDLDAGEDVGNIAKILHGGLAYASLVGIYSEWHLPIVDAMTWLKKLGLTKGTPRMYINDFVADAIRDRRKARDSGEKATEAEEADESTPKDMLDKFLDANDRDGQRFTNGDIGQGIGSNVVAGADTTSATLTALLYHLLKNPGTLEKLRREIDEGVASGSLSSPVTFKQAQELPYLQAVIQETLRVHPAVGLPLERVVPAGGATICGLYFPEGTIVGVNAWVLHYDTDVFGTDAAEFRPERWLESDKESLARMNPQLVTLRIGKPHMYWQEYQHAGDDEVNS